jgi:hypothetical protein
LEANDSDASSLPLTAELDKIEEIIDPTLLDASTLIPIPASNDELKIEFTKKTARCDVRGINSAGASTIVDRTLRSEVMSPCTVEKANASQVPTTTY